MLVKSFQFFALVLALMCSSINAQDCSSCSSMLVNGGGYGSAPAAGMGYSDYGSLGGAGYVGDDCGRSISYSQAASLWSGYCTETCGYPGTGGASCGGGGLMAGFSNNFGGGYAIGGSSCGGGGGCKLLGGHGRGLLRGLFSKFGGGGFGGGFGGGGCCSQGCFGYPAGGCGCGGGGYGGAIGGGLFGGGLFSTRNSTCGGGGGCKLLGGGGGHGLLRGLLGRCKLFGGCGSHGGGAMSGYSTAYISPTSFDLSASQCGSSNAYFNEFVGPEYGTTGMQSVVSGCTSGCNGSAIGYGDAAGYGLMGAGQPIGTGSYGGEVISGGQTYGYGSGQAYGQPNLNPGETYLGGHDPTANAKEIVGEAVEAATNAATDAN